eukprot:gene16546-biopygen1645
MGECPLPHGCQVLWRTEKSTGGLWRTWGPNWRTGGLPDSGWRTLADWRTSGGLADFWRTLADLFPQRIFMEAGVLHRASSQHMRIHSYEKTQNAFLSFLRRQR